MRLLTMLLVCIILLNFISQPKAEAIGGSLALALGGTSAAKAFLAFIMSCIAMGVTYVTIDDAMAAYENYTENASISTDYLRYVQQETWIGNYDAVLNDLTDIHSGIKDWLTGIFGTLNIGNNQTKPEWNVVNNYPIKLDIRFQDNYYYLDLIYYNSTGLKSMELIKQSKEIVEYKLIDLIPEDNGHIINYQYKYISNDSILTQNRYTTIIYPITLDNITDTLDTNTTNISISADAPILNPSYSPQNRTFPPAPYLPYINPGNEKVSESISASGGTMEVYNGTYDQYLDDLVDNATWEDIQGVISGSVPTTTLTETSEGLIIGESTVGIPYPIPDTTAPGEVLTGLGGIMGLLQGITNWIAQLWQLISGIFEIPEGLALDFSSLKLEGFKDKFPFSIPWDIYRAVAVFAKTPETPEFNIDIETDYLDINHSINLDPIDLPLRFARYVMSIFFIFFLASKTRDLIKW
jgi:hypothetical protein